MFHPLRIFIVHAVSRVINNRQEIIPKTREHVKRVIKHLGYQPNAIARSLSLRRSHTLGIVTSGLQYYGPSHILVGMEQGANRQGFSILLNLLHQPENENDEEIQEVQEKQFRAEIETLTRQEHTRALQELISSPNLPR
jgi:DNA-binding LacI/PurR family transcriptional regulator